MTQGKISDDWNYLYDIFFRKDAHQLLAWGYEDARSQINADNEETDITGFIASKIENRLDDQHEKLAPLVREISLTQNYLLTI